MSAYAGPGSITNGLVFAYDMGNQEKSWKGKPTVNHISDPTEEMARGEFGQYRDLAPTFNTNGLVPHSLSMDIKANKPGGVYVYMQNGSYTKYGFVSSSVNVTTEYQRFYFDNITPSVSTPSETAAILATYTGYGSGITPTVKNIQLELGTFSTPFVVGTRSSTQAILDQTNNITLTATSLTYNIDGTFSFNGSSDYVSVSNGMNLLVGTSSVTFSAWIFRTSAPAYWAGIISNKVNVTDGICLLVNPDSKIFWQYDGGTSGVYAIYGGATLPTNTWCNIVGVYDNEGLKTYLNGVLNDSAADPGKSISSAGNMDITIGAQDSGPGGPFPGRISQCSIYNRALSAKEIQQNFQALRGRYGI